MKTNHQRDFVDKITAYVGQGRNGGGYDATCGKHGIAQQNRGRKKFFNSRARFAVDSLVRKILKMEDVDSVAVSTHARSKRLKETS